MQRRQFFKTAARLAIAAGLSPSLSAKQEPKWLQEFRETGRLIGQGITLHEPLVLVAGENWLCIRNNIFRVSSDFGDQSVLRILGSPRGELINNKIVSV